MLGWPWCGFHKKNVQTLYAKLVFLHLVGSAGHVVQSGASGRETSTDYFSWSGGTGTDSTRMAPGHVTPNLYFFIWWDLRVIWCIPVRPGCEISTQYFSCSRWPQCFFQKNCSLTRHTKLVFLHPVGSVGHIVHSGA
jgi:hypothetical protein